jgi:hypothetical protein
MIQRSMKCCQLVQFLVLVLPTIHGTVNQPKIEPTKRKPLTKKLRIATDRPNGLTLQQRARPVQGDNSEKDELLELRGPKLQKEDEILKHDTRCSVIGGSSDGTWYEADCGDTPAADQQKQKKSHQHDLESKGGVTHLGLDQKKVLHDLVAPTLGPSFSDDVEDNDVSSESSKRDRGSGLDPKTVVYDLAAEPDEYENKNASSKSNTKYKRSSGLLDPKNLFRGQAAPTTRPSGREYENENERSKSSTKEKRSSDLNENNLIHDVAAPTTSPSIDDEYEGDDASRKSSKRYKGSINLDPTKLLHDFAAPTTSPSYDDEYEDHDEASSESKTRYKESSEKSSRYHTDGFEFFIHHGGTRGEEGSGDNDIHTGTPEREESAKGRGKSGKSGKGGRGIKHDKSKGKGKGKKGKDGSGKRKGGKGKPKTYGFEATTDHPTVAPQPYPQPSRWPTVRPFNRPVIVDPPSRKKDIENTLSPTPESQTYSRSPSLTPERDLGPGTFAPTPKQQNDQTTKQVCLCQLQANKHSRYPAQLSRRCLRRLILSLALQLHQQPCPQLFWIRQLILPPISLP